MTPTDIATEIGAASPADAIERTRYALAKQAPNALEALATHYGPLALTPDELADLRRFLHMLLTRRLEALEGGADHV